MHHPGQHHCIVIVTNAASNVAVRFPAIPRLPVTIIAMSISFQSQPPHLWNQGNHEARQTVMAPTLGVLHFQEKHKHPLNPT
jgi:hypothetical protein